MRKNLLKFIVIFFLLLIPIFYGSAALLMDGGGGGGGTSKLEEILTKIKDTLKTLGYIVCVIFMIIGGYQMITASGDPKKFETGQKTLLYAAIGFIIILLADEIVTFIRTKILGGP
jgi:type IV secretory pathway VirB2 component (pilin)